MILYFDDTGKLVTMIPHGEVPRQNGSLNIQVFFDEDFSTTNKMVVLRYKRPGDLTFSQDVIMNYTGTVTFEKLEGEDIGSLVDGEDYKVYSMNMGAYNATDFAGDLKISIYVSEYTVVNNVNVEDTSTRLQLGKATIYIEETLGLAPNEGLGMTRSEYEELMALLQTVAATYQGLISGELSVVLLKNDRTNGSILIRSNLNLGGLEIINANVATPTDDTNIANKKYVDDKVATVQNVVESLIGGDVASYLDFATQLNQLKTDFYNFMNNSSADNIINTLSEIRTSLSNLESAINNRTTEAQVRQIIDDIFADVSEDEY